MGEQYNGVLFFNDNVYLMNFINKLINLEPTEENFRYLSNLVAFIERDGKAKIDSYGPENNEVKNTEREIAKRFTAAAEQLIINIACKKFPERDFEFRVKTEEMISFLNMPTDRYPLIDQMSLDEMAEVLPDALNPFMGGNPMGVGNKVPEPIDDPLVKVTPIDEKVKPVPDDQNPFMGGDPMESGNKVPEAGDDPLVRVTPIDEVVKPVPDDQNPFMGGNPMGIDESLYNRQMPAPEGATTEQQVTVRSDAQPQFDPDTKNYSPFTPKGGMSEYYSFRFQERPQAPTNPLIINPENAMDTYYNLEFPVPINAGNKAPDDPNISSGGRQRK